MSGSGSRFSSTALFCGVPLTEAAAAFDCPFVALSLCNRATKSCRSALDWRINYVAEVAEVVRVRTEVSRLQLRL